MTRVAVVGGGIAGLAAAYRLTVLGIDPVVFEAAPTAGGTIVEVDVEGLMLPAGPDAFVARKPSAVDLCRQLGVPTVPPSARGTWLWTTAGLVPYPSDTAFGIPGDPGEVLRWPGVSNRGRRRALADLLKGRRKDPDDETLGALLRRRLGDEVAEAALGPILAGLSAGDLDRLSVRATFPELQAWERAQGSLIRGAQAALRDSRRGTDPAPMFLAPAGGMAALPAALMARLGDAVRCRTAATAVTPRSVRTSDGAEEAVDAVIVSTSAADAAGLVDQPEGASALGRLESASAATVLFVYAEDTAERMPDGAGFVVPRGKAPMSSSTWLSSKWPRGRYGGRAVIRCLVGGDGQEDLLEATDGEIVEACERHLAALLPLPEHAEAARVVRWPDAMPQYRLGHGDVVAAIRERLPAGIFVAGQSYDGVGVADAARSGLSTAEAAAAFLGIHDAAPIERENDR